MIQNSHWKRRPWFLPLILALGHLLALSAFGYNFEALEFFGLAKTVHDIRSAHPPSEYVYVGIGRSPAPMIAYHQEYGDSAFNLPLTWSSSHYEDVIKAIRKAQNKTKDENYSLDLAQLEGMNILSARDKMKLKDHFNRFLAPAIEQAIKTGKKLLLMDFVSTGMGLFLTNLYMNDFLKKTGLQGKLKVEYLGIGLDDNTGLKFKSKDWHSYILDSTETLPFHGSMVLKKIKDHAEYGNFVVDGDSTDSKKIKPNPRYKDLQRAIKERHPQFLRQISYANERYAISKIKEFGRLIQRKVLDNTCPPEKTLAVFDIDDVLTIDELDDSYPMAKEVETTLVLKAIQRAGITTMGLTNRAAFTDTKVPARFQRTTAELNSLGIKFGKSSAVIEEGLKRKGYMVTNKNVKEGFHYDGRNSVFHQGIFSLGRDPQGKGPLLENLLKNADLHNWYQCIFFVDDSLANNKSVEDTFKYKINLFSANLKVDDGPKMEFLEDIERLVTHPESSGLTNHSSSCNVEEVD